jgi:hypothetical protein
MMKKFFPETSPTASPWPLSAYVYDEKRWYGDLLYSMFMGYTAYISDEKGGSRDFRFGMYMACASYIRDEKSWSRDFPTACSLPEQPIYTTKIVGPETSPTAYKWHAQHIYAT